jgi:hypothetical protein
MNKQKILLGLVIFLLAAAGVVGGIVAVRQTVRYLSHGNQPAGQPLNLSTDAATPDRVTISWTTQDEVLSLIQYGTSSTQLNQTQSELSSTTSHRLVLNQLQPDTKYFYKIQVGQQIFDDQGQPYSFTTAPSPEKTPIEFSEQTFRDAFGSSDPDLDINGDGIVNTFDYSLYLQQQSSN